MADRDAVELTALNCAAVALDQEIASPEPGFPTSYIGGEVEKMYDVLRRQNTGEVLSGILKSSGVVKPLSNLFGPNLVTTLNRHNVATVNRRGQKPRLHRDILQPCRGLAMYLIPRRVYSGQRITWVIPSSHLSPRVGVPQIDGGGTWMDEHPVFDHLLDQMVPIPTKPGDMLVFNGLTFHTVGYNNTDKTRKSAIFGVRAVDEQGFVDPKRELLIAGNAIYRGNDLKRIVRDPEVIKAIQQGVPIRSNEYLSGLKGLSDVIDLLPDGRPIDGLTHVLGTHGSKGLRLDVPNFVITEWNLRAVRRALASNIRQNDQSLNFFKRRSAKVARNLLIELQGYEEPTPPDINILLDVLGI